MNKFLIYFKSIRVLDIAVMSRERVWNKSVINNGSFMYNLLSNDLKNIMDDSEFDNDLFVVFLRESWFDL